MMDSDGSIDTCIPGVRVPSAVSFDMASEVF